MSLSMPSVQSSMWQKDLVCSPSPQISISGLSLSFAIATLRHMAAGAFSRPHTVAPLLHGGPAHETNAACAPANPSTGYFNTSTVDVRPVCLPVRRVDRTLDVHYDLIEQASSPG